MTKKTKVCSKCELEKHSREYYRAASDLIHKDSRIGVCKECIESVVDFQDRKSVIRLMREINRPFLYETYERIIERDDEKTHIGEYMRQIAMPQNINLDYGNSIFGKSNSQQDAEKVEAVFDIDDDDRRYLVETWGRGFSDEEYEFLQLEYEQYANSYEIDGRAMEILLQEASHQRLAIKNKREAGESPKQEIETLTKLLGDAKIKPQQETGADASNQATFGTLIKQFEEERPVPEPAEEWKDVDGVMDTVKIITGQIAKMFNVKSKDAQELVESLESFGVTEEDLEEELDEDDLIV